MAPADFPYTFVVRKKSGLELWYFRHRAFLKPRRISGLPGSPEFYRQYSTLLAEAKGEAQAEAERSDTRSVRWLVEQYLDSDEWSELSEASRRDYRRHLNRLTRLGGDLPFASLTKGGVLALRKTVKAETIKAQELALQKRLQADRDRENAGLKPFKKRALPKVSDGSRTADYFVSVLSALYSWAIEHEELPHDAINPAAGTKKLRKKSKVEGRRPWTEEQIRAVLKTAPRHIRDGVILGLYTGQRLGDCVAMRKSNYIAPILRVRQFKTGNLVDVHAVGPMLELATRRMDANDDCDHLLIREDGQSYPKRQFSEHLRQHLDGLGFRDISFHGLRYAAAGTLNEAGATVATIVSILGHSTYAMAVKYLQARESQQNAARLMQEAADRRST